jgi:hypothetical protein
MKHGRRARALMAVNVCYQALRGRLNQKKIFFYGFLTSVRILSGRVDRPTTRQTSG